MHMYSTNTVHVCTYELLTGVYKNKSSYLQCNTL